MSGPVSKYSRDLFCLGVLDAGGNLFLTERVPFRYVYRPDNTEHTACEGDTWAALAAAYYPDIPDAAFLLWYVIPDFQPVPVLDPTLAVVPGTVVYVPSHQTLVTEVLSENRRLDFMA